MLVIKAEIWPQDNDDGRFEIPKYTRTVTDLLKRG